MLALLKIVATFILCSRNRMHNDETDPCSYRRWQAETQQVESGIDSNLHPRSLFCSSWIPSSMNSAGKITSISLPHPTHSASIHEADLGEIRLNSVCCSSYSSLQFGQGSSLLHVGAQRERRLLVVHVRVVWTARIFFYALQTPSKTKK